MLDAWAIDTVDDAAALVGAARSARLTWFEEPVQPDDWAGYSELRRRAPEMRIAAGERWYGVAPFARMAASGDVDVLQPDVQWVAGLTPTLEIARIATTHGLELAIYAKQSKKARMDAIERRHAWFTRP